MKIYHTYQVQYDYDQLASVHIQAETGPDPDDTLHDLPWRVEVVPDNPLRPCKVFQVEASSGLLAASIAMEQYCDENGIDNGTFIWS